jgi:hypothetical protein
MFGFGSGVGSQQGGFGLPQFGAGQAGGAGAVAPRPPPDRFTKEEALPVFRLMKQMLVCLHRNGGRRTAEYDQLRAEAFQRCRSDQRIYEALKMHVQKEVTKHQAAQTASRLGGSGSSTQTMLSLSMLALGYLQRGRPIPFPLVAMARDAVGLRTPSTSADPAVLAALVAQQQPQQPKQNQQRLQHPQNPASTQAALAPVPVRWEFQDVINRQREHYISQPTAPGLSAAELQAIVRQKVYYLSQPGKRRSELSIYASTPPWTLAAHRAEREGAFLAAVRSHCISLQGAWQLNGEYRKQLCVEILEVGRIREFRRLQALKEQNMVDYLRDLRARKDERLDMIIEQTNACLGGIMSSLSKTHGAVFGAALLALDPSECAQRIRSAMFEYGSHIAVPALLQLPLKTYQVEGFRWLASLHHHRINGILADEMGLGKTVQTIAFFLHLHSQGIKGPHLVVCPLSVVPNWLAELKRWCPALSVAHWTTSIAPAERSKYFKAHVQHSNVVVTTYDFIRDYKASTKNKGLRIPHLKSLRWYCLVVDEGHHLANENTSLARALRDFRCQHRLILTGTPLQNKLHELWALLNFLLPSVFERADDFESWFQAPFQNTPDGKTEITKEVENPFLSLSFLLHQSNRRASPSSCGCRRF